MIVHSSNNYFNKTLVNHLINYLGLNAIQLFRLGFLNRLDKDTTGLTVISKTLNFYINYLNQFFKNILKKYYVFFIFGKLKSIFLKSFLFNKFNSLRVNKKHSFTFIKLIKTVDFFNYPLYLFKCKLIYGRSHQIRIHLNFLKRFIVLDNLYNPLNKIHILKYANRQLIHLYFINFFYLNRNFSFYVNIFNDMLNILNLK